MSSTAESLPENPVKSWVAQSPVEQALPKNAVKSWVAQSPVEQALPENAVKSWVAQSPVEHKAQLSSHSQIIQSFPPHAQTPEDIICKLGL